MAISSVCLHCWIGLLRGLLLGTVMAGLTASATACAGQGSASAVPENSPVRLEVSPMFVSIENRAGLPLTDITMSIMPSGAGDAFTASLVRLDSEEKRNIMLRDFRRRDGMSFSLPVAKPKTVRIDASDLSGKKYEVEYPWNR